MAFSSALFLPLLVYVSVFSFEFTRADEKACSIERNGTLTMFNGETADAGLPCKYRLSDFTCGDFRVKVTPGSTVDKDYSHRFSPDSLVVKVTNATTGAFLNIRTSVKRLDKVSKGKLSNPWQVKKGSVSVVDFADYDQSKAAAVLRKDGVFSVEFSSAERSVVVTCSDEEFVSKGLPETLCGDGTTTDAMKTAITTLFPGQEDMTDDALVTYVVLNHDNVVQSSKCKDMASKFRSCEDKEQAAMECVAIFGDQAECLAGSDTSLRDYYAECLTSVCDANPSALEPMNNYIKDNCETAQEALTKPKSCVDMKEIQSESGVATIYPTDDTPLKVYCDQDTDGGGWTVFQRRQDGSVDFYRNWTEYENGFGDLNGEFWLGLDALHMLTSRQPYELRVDLMKWDNTTGYATYSNFSISDSGDKYRLTLGGFTGGNAGDGMGTDAGLKFSTWDNDNDMWYYHNCAQVRHGAWWYRGCSAASLNGGYKPSKNAQYGHGIWWSSFGGNSYSHKLSEMKIRVV